MLARSDSAATTKNGSDTNRYDLIRRPCEIKHIKSHYAAAAAAVGDGLNGGGPARSQKAEVCVCASKAPHQQ